MRVQSSAFTHVARDFWGCSFKAPWSSIPQWESLQWVWKSLLMDWWPSPNIGDLPKFWALGSKMILNDINLYQIISKSKMNDDKWAHSTVFMRLPGASSSKCQAISATSNPRIPMLVGPQPLSGMLRETFDINESLTLYQSDPVCTTVPVHLWQEKHPTVKLIKPFGAIRSSPVLSHPTDCLSGSLFSIACCNGTTLSLSWLKSPYWKFRAQCKSYRLGRLRPRDNPRHLEPFGRD